MGKGQRIKEARKNVTELERPVYTLTVNIYEDNQVRVHGPIADPVLVMYLVSRLLNNLVNHYSGEREKMADAMVAKETDGGKKS